MVQPGKRYSSISFLRQGKLLFSISLAPRTNLDSSLSTVFMRHESLSLPILAAEQHSRSSRNALLLLLLSQSKAHLFGPSVAVGRCGRKSFDQPACTVRIETWVVGVTAEAYPLLPTFLSASSSSLNNEVGFPRVISVPSPLRDSRSR